MLSDTAKQGHECFLSQITKVFGDDAELVETRGSYSWHGYFYIKFWYRPAKIYIIIEAQSWYFSVRLEQEDGCFTPLGQIKLYENRVSVSNIIEVIDIIKDVIDQPITFYKSTGSALYRKEGDMFIKLSWDDIRALTNKNTTDNKASD